MTEEKRQALESCADDANAVYEAIATLVNNIRDNEFESYLVGQLKDDGSDDPERIITIIQNAQVMFENITCRFGNLAQGGSDE